MRFLTLLLIFIVCNVAAQDVIWSTKETKKHDGSISTEIVYGHHQDNKIYERWTLFDTISDQNPKPDVIEKFFYGTYTPIEIRYHQGARKVIFRSADRISVVANLEEIQLEDRCITLMDASNNTVIRWSVGEDGFFTNLTNHQPTE